MSAADTSAQHALYRDHHGWLTRWLSGRLYCSEQVADIAHRCRYGDCRSTGTFPLRDIDLALAALTSTLPISEQRKTALWIHIAARAP